MLEAKEAVPPKLDVPETVKLVVFKSLYVIVPVTIKFVVVVVPVTFKLLDVVILPDEVMVPDTYKLEEIVKPP